MNKSIIRNTIVATVATTKEISNNIREISTETCEYGKTLYHKTCKILNDEASEDLRDGFVAGAIFMTASIYLDLYIRNKTKRK